MLSMLAYRDIVALCTMLRLECCGMEPIGRRGDMAIPSRLHLLEDGALIRPRFSVDFGQIPRIYGAEDQEKTAFLLHQM